MCQVNSEFSIQDIVYMFILCLCYQKIKFEYLFYAERIIKANEYSVWVIDSKAKVIKSE